MVLNLFLQNGLDSLGKDVFKWRKFNICE
ncbi:MAG TPA: hypothetical protein DCW52_12305 [Gammaproteobacteria bacterium]|nr:hypothetical protein [Gammaproteobacteria bacterium]